MPNAIRKPDLTDRILAALPTMPLVAVLIAGIVMWAVLS